MIRVGGVEGAEVGCGWRGKGEEEDFAAGVRALWLGEGGVEEARADDGWGGEVAGAASRWWCRVGEGATEEGRGEEEKDRGGNTSQGGRRVKCSVTGHATLSYCIRV